MGKSSFRVFGVFRGYQFRSLPSSRRCDGFILQRSEDAFENPFAILAAKQWFAGTFGMWHQAGYVAPFIADAGNVLKCTIGIRAVGQIPVLVAILPQDLIVGLELRERFFVSKIAAFAVGDGYA